MQLHQVQPKFKIKKKKRIARGGKRGTYSGRGLKGQKSRAGRRIKPATKENILKMPKLRGIDFKFIKPKAKIINLIDLDQKINNEIINRKVLIESGLINKSDKKIKILGKGELTKVFKISNDIEVSKGAKEKIEKAGGSIL